jgi:hypothetical protein
MQRQRLALLIGIMISVMNRASAFAPVGNLGVIAARGRSALISAATRPPQGLSAGTWGSGRASRAVLRAPMSMQAANTETPVRDPPSEHLLFCGYSVHGDCSAPLSVLLSWMPSEATAGPHCTRKRNMAGVKAGEIHLARNYFVRPMCTMPSSSALCLCRLLRNPVERMHISLCSVNAILSSPWQVAGPGFAYICI